MEQSGVSLKTLVTDTVAACGMTMEDVLDVSLNHPEHPTKVVISFRDDTAVDIDIKYPANA